MKQTGRMLIKQWTDTDTHRASTDTSWNVSLIGLGQVTGFTNALWALVCYVTCLRVHASSSARGLADVICADITSLLEARPPPPTGLTREWYAQTCIVIPPPRPVWELMSHGHNGHCWHVVNKVQTPITPSSRWLHWWQGRGVRLCNTESVGASESAWTPTICCLLLVPSSLFIVPHSISKESDNVSYFRHRAPGSACSLCHLLSVWESLRDCESGTLYSN